MYHYCDDHSKGCANAKAQIGIVRSKEDRNEERDIAACQCPETLRGSAQSTHLIDTSLFSMILGSENLACVHAEVVVTQAPWFPVPQGAGQMHCTVVQAMDSTCTP